MKRFGVLAVSLLNLFCVQLSYGQGQPFPAHVPSQDQQRVFDQYGTVLRQLIIAHPSPEVYQDLNRLITNGDILLTYETLSETNVYGENAVASFALVSIDGGATMPVLIIDVASLMDQYTPKEFKQLVIYHEYQHYRQYMEGRYPERLFMAWTEDDTMTEAEAVGLYQSEVEAYELECSLANDLGWEEVFELCTVLDDQMSFHLSVAQTLLVDPKMHAHKSAIMALANKGL